MNSSGSGVAPSCKPWCVSGLSFYLALPWNATLLEGVLFSRKTLFQGNTVLEGILSAMARKSFFKVTHSASHLMVVTRKASVSVYLVMVSKNTFNLALPWNATLLEGVLFSRKTLFQGNTVLEGILSAMARKSFFKVGLQESLCICIPSYGL